MASSSSYPHKNEEHHALLLASSSSPPQKYDFPRASSSSSHKQDEDFQLFSGIKPPRHKRRKVSESSRLYDVFINHRGPDVKETLALHLYKSLEKLNIRAFLDSKEKVLGDSFPSTIETAIRSAAVHIAIFSKGYAESPWCLEELDLMLRSKAKIIPLFYGVKPSDLRYIEKGVYGKAFADYENKKRYIEKLGEWKKDLQSISFIAGEEFNSFSDCENRVSAVQKEVEKKRHLYVAKYPVGLPKLVEDFGKHCIDKVVQDFEIQCKTNKQREGNAKIVGIFGMGGVGKTTLSKELFNRKRSDYSRSCFLFDVREASVKFNVPSLQVKLLAELFDEKEKDHRKYPSVEDGKSRLGHHIQRRNNLSFLIVLDDIDHLDQLDDLLIKDMLDKSGNSLVIVTTRDVGVLINAGITVAYNLKGMDTDDAKELSCWHAFSQSYPSNGYEKLVDLFVGVCGGLPLSLQVLGRHVHGQDQKFWELELKKVKKTLPQDIHKRLRISIDTLDNEEKQIFMDVACFFLGELTTDAIRVWEGSGWDNAEHALQRLKNKCLVEERSRIDNQFHDLEQSLVGERKKNKFMVLVDDVLEDSTEGKFVLRMHDHLRDLGQEMADELSHPRRLWRPQHLESLISKGFENILTQPRVRCLHSFRNQYTGGHIKYFLGEAESMLEPSTALLWLELDHWRPTLTNIPLQNLQRLRISGGYLAAHLKGFWQTDVQESFPIKVLEIKAIHDLDELSLGLLCSLEKLVIYGCAYLTRVTGIFDLTKLTELNISKCGKFELEELSLGHLRCLERILVHNCKYLKIVTGISDLKKLLIFAMSNCETIEELSFDQLSSLKRITIHDCGHLKSVTGISDLAELIELNIRKCGELEEISFVQISYPEIQTIHNCKHLKSVIRISDLTKLEILHIYSCGKIEELSLAQLSCLRMCSVPDVPTLKRVELKRCENLHEVNGISSNLVKLNVYDCPELEINPDIEKLERMQLFNCSKRTIRNCIVHMEKLPSDFIKVIGTAVNGAESTLNANVFCNFNSVNSVIEFGIDNICNHLGRHVVGAIILCAVVVVNTSEAAKRINDSIGDCDWSPWLKFEVRQGKWIITSVTRREDEIMSYVVNKGCCFPFDYLCFPEDVRVEKVTMPVMKGEEYKILNVLRRIVDKLYQP
ncbi:hypothetical protein SUGI_0676280 [Cryptomeria japonica]|nr:hypothetical protein SUGI_0676280 [Cryptomeria japonica]